jgi:hypothetical protein
MNPISPVCQAAGYWPSPSCDARRGGKCDGSILGVRRCPPSWFWLARPCCCCCCLLSAQSAESKYLWSCREAAIPSLQNLPVDCDPTFFVVQAVTRTKPASWLPAQAAERVGGEPRPASSRV